MAIYPTGYSFNIQANTWILLTVLKPIQSKFNVLENQLHINWKAVNTDL